MEGRWKRYVSLSVFYGIAGSSQHPASCLTYRTGSAECPITEGPLAPSMCRGYERAGELKEPQMSSWELFHFPGTATFSHLNTQFTEGYVNTAYSPSPHLHNTHTLTRTRLIVPFKKQNENSISLCSQKMERGREISSEAGIFSNYSASFAVIPQGKLWSTREAEEKVALVY